MIYDLDFPIKTPEFRGQIFATALTFRLPESILVRYGWIQLSDLRIIHSNDIYLAIIVILYELNCLGMDIN